MICPNATCQAAIPDDSIYCDQCGRPVAPKTELVLPAAASVVAHRTETIAAKSDAATAFAGRPVQAMDPTHLRLSLPDGSVAVLASGDVIGHSEGPLAPLWPDAGLVSDRHGRVEQVAGTWTYTDLFSANGSSLNGHFVRPGKPVAVQPGDQLVLGNRSLVVL